MMNTTKMFVEDLPCCTTRLDKSLTTTAVNILLASSIRIQSKLTISSWAISPAQRGLQLGPTRAVNLLGVVTHTLVQGVHQPKWTDFVELLSLYRALGKPVALLRIMDYVAILGSFTDQIREWD